MTRPRPVLVVDNDKGDVVSSDIVRFIQRRMQITKKEPIAYCMFCKKEHEGGANCLGHHP